jgi:hypothetical protein
MKRRCKCFHCKRFLYIGEQAIASHGNADGWICPDCTMPGDERFDYETGEPVDMEGE